MDTVNSFFGADCYRFSEDVDLGNPLVSTCATGYTKVGYDENGCTALGVSLLMNGLNSSMYPFLTYLTDDMRPANLLCHGHCSNHMSMARF